MAGELLKYLSLIDLATLRDKLMEAYETGGEDVAGRLEELIVEEVERLRPADRDFSFKRDPPVSLNNNYLNYLSSSTLNRTHSQLQIKVAAIS